MSKSLGSVFTRIKNASRGKGSHVLAALAFIRNRFMPAADDPTPALKALFAAPSLENIRHVIHAYPILLDPKTATFIQQAAAGPTTPAQRDHIDRIVWILQHCREQGTDAWFDAFFEESRPLRDLLEHFAKKRAEPVDLGPAPAEDDEPSTARTVAAQLVATYRGEDYPYGAEQERAIKEAQEDRFLVLLTKKSTTETDWAEASRKIERLHRQSAIKHITALAEKNADDPLLTQIGFEFIKVKTPNAFALRAEDGSIAIGIDPGLYAIFALLFHAAQIGIYNGNQTLFIDILNDLVKSHFLRMSVHGSEERILHLTKIEGVFQRHWADCSGYIALVFLLGHEVGHVHLRHLEKKQAPHVRMGFLEDSETEITAFDRDTEFEADAWSARELIGTANDLSSIFGACTMPAIFMTIMAMIEDAYIPHDPIGKIQRDTHPPAWQRAQRLSEIGKNHLARGLKLPGEIERLLELPEALDSIRSSREFQEAAARTRSLARELQRSEVQEARARPSHDRRDTHLRVTRAREAADRGLTALGYSLPAPISHATVLPTAPSDGHADSAPPDLNPAGFGSGFFEFTLAWGDVLAGCFLGVEDGVLLDRFIDVCFCEITLGSSAYLDWRPEPNFKIAELGDRLATVFEAFSVSREYAHVLLNHQPLKHTARTKSGSVAGFKREDESAADSLGFQAALRAFADPEFTYMSVAGYFCARQLIERGTALLNGDPSIFPTGGPYPPAAERRAAVLNLANKLIPPEAMRPAVANLNRVEDITIRMWQPLERGFWSRSWHTSEHIPPDWAPRNPGEKTMALLAFKIYCLGLPASLQPDLV